MRHESKWGRKVRSAALALLGGAVLAAAPAGAPANSGGKPVETKSTQGAVSVDGYHRVGFDVLAAFPFEPPEAEPDAKPGTPPPSAANQIPAAIKAFDGRKVVVSGYMMPLKMEKGLVTELLLVANSQLCCYGATPRINEFVVVKMKPGSGVKPLADIPVDFFGTITVREVFEEGYLSQIYTLAGDKMGKPAE